MNARFLVREYGKARVRSALQRWNLGLVRDPYEAQLSRALANLEIDTVLDVGANIGQYAHALIHRGYRGRIISCEPLSDAFEQLRRRSGVHPLWTAVRTAVGAEVGTGQINVAGNSYSSSVLTVNSTHLAADARSRTVRREDVAFTTVDLLVERFEVDPGRCLLKADVQGYETALLDGAPATLKSFAAIQVEMSFVPLYEGQELYPAVLERLVAAGFMLYALNPGISDRVSGRLLQMDALFVRDDLVLE